MQRRAAAGYGAFFLVIGIVAGALYVTGMLSNTAGWLGISLLSLITAGLLISLSYMPVRG